MAHKRLWHIFTSHSLFSVHHASTLYPPSVLTSASTIRPDLAVKASFWSCHPAVTFHYFFREIHNEWKLQHYLRASFTSTFTFIVPSDSYLSEISANMSPRSLLQMAQKACIKDVKCEFTLEDRSPPKFVRNANSVGQISNLWAGYL